MKEKKIDKIMKRKNNRDKSKKNGKEEESIRKKMIN